MEQIINIFNEENIKYIVIGGQAIRLHGMPRFTMDWDILIPGKDIENINKINNALAGIVDMDLIPLGEKGQNFIQTFQTIHGIIEFHLIPVGIPKFNDANKNAIKITSENGINVNCLSIQDLYSVKKKICRSKDEADILFLEEKLKINNNK